MIPLQGGKWPDQCHQLKMGGSVLIFYDYFCVVCVYACMCVRPGWEFPDNNFNINVYLHERNRVLLIPDTQARQRTHVCAQKSCPPWGYTLHSLEVSEALGYSWHLCFHTRQSARHNDQTTVVSCRPGGIRESGFTFWPSGVNYSQGWVSHICRQPPQNAVNRQWLWVKLQKNVGPVMTKINEDAIQNKESN